MQRMDLSRVEVGAVLEGVVCVASRKVATTRNGAEYLQIVVRNRTGELSGRIWSDRMDAWAGIDAGRAVWMEAEVKDGWRGGPPELGTVFRLERLEPGHPVEAERHPVCPVPLPTLEAQLEALVARIRGGGARALYEAVLQKVTYARFREAPAAIGHHHNYRHGLLEHSIEVARLALMGAEVCRDRASIDTDMLIVGALLHDVGKVDEYIFDEEFAIAPLGRLLPHTVYGPMLVQCVVARGWPELKSAGTTRDQLLHLAHTMASHHGQREWGAACEIVTPEALLIHHCDNFSAKLRSMMDQLARCQPDADGWLMNPTYPHRHPIFFHAERAEARSKSLMPGEAVS